MPFVFEMVEFGGVMFGRNQVKIDSKMGQKWTEIWSKWIEIGSKRVKKGQE